MAVQVVDWGAEIGEIFWLLGWLVGGRVEMAWRTTLRMVDWGWGGRDTLGGLPSRSAGTDTSGPPHKSLKIYEPPQKIYFLFLHLMV